jgi:putative ABC transport system substrate-binding protein
MPVIGRLSAQSADDGHNDFTVPFLQGLKETGYVAGHNVAVEYRYAQNEFDRLPALAADLVRRRVAVIVAYGASEALAVKAATTTIPIVFFSVADPVKLGLIASLNQPDANLTGSAGFSVELSPKRLQLLRELMPNAAVFGVLADPAFSTTQSMITDLQSAARTLGLQLPGRIATSQSWRLCAQPARPEAQCQTRSSPSPSSAIRPVSSVAAMWSAYWSEAARPC